MTGRAAVQSWHALAHQASDDGCSPTNAWDKVRALYPHVTRAAVSSHLLRRRNRADSPVVAEWKDKANDAMEALQHQRDIYDWLRPVELPAPVPRKVTGKPNDYTLVAGDQHFPSHDPATLAILVQTVAALKPKRVILNGDTVDLLAVSRYPKDARAGFSWTLRDEVEAFHAFLRDLHGVGDAWGMEIVETSANHSGNGTEGRWWRYLSERCPDLLGHAEAESILAYERWFYPKWSSIRLVQEVVIADDLLVIHGDMVRGKGGYTARAHQEKWMSSTMNSHTHRAGSTIRRVPKVGTREEGVMRSYEIGCCCSLSPSYSRVPDWANAFAVISHDDAKGLYGVEIVNVVGGRASVAALGSSLAA